MCLSHPPVALLLLSASPQQALFVSHFLKIFHLLEEANPYR